MFSFLPLKHSHPHLAAAGAGPERMAQRVGHPCNAANPVAAPHHQRGALVRA
jgi:hypothetical protein